MLSRERKWQVPNRAGEKIQTSIWFSSSLPSTLRLHWRMNYSTWLLPPWANLVYLCVSQSFCLWSPFRQEEHNIMAEGNFEPWVANTAAATILRRNRFNCSEKAIWPEHQTDSLHHPRDLLRLFYSLLTIQWLPTRFDINSKLHIMAYFCSLSSYPSLHSIHVDLFSIFILFFLFKFKLLNIQSSLGFRLPSCTSVQPSDLSLTYDTKFSSQKVLSLMPVALLTHHLCHLPSSNPVCSLYLRVSYNLSSSLFLSDFPSPMLSVVFLKFHIWVKSYDICLPLTDLFHVA